METTFRLKVSELDAELISAIKELFHNDREIQLTISTASPDMGEPETREAYFARLKKAADNLNEGRGVSLTEEELNEFVLDKLKG